LLSPDVQRNQDRAIGGATSVPQPNTIMKSMLISYDLIGTNETSEDYRRLIARIKEYPK
jgi:hypothetical protein